MNDDLISRKVLLESMDKRYKEKSGIVQDNLAEGFVQMEKLIKEQPTAYDVDRVVEQLESEYLMCRCKNKEACSFPETIGCCYDNGIKKAIEIVN